MQNTFHVFGPAHLLALALVPLLAATLAALHRRFPSWGKIIRSSLAVLLLVTTVAYYGSFVAAGERIFPNHVPLELCDISLWVMIFTLIRLKPAVFDVAYYWALAGAGMALLTPNLTRPSPLMAVQFFASHGLIVVAVLYLVWSRQARPRPGSVRKAMIAVNLVAIPVGIFDYVFKTDYMFLCTKPPTVSLLDVFGPWPWYILACEAAGLVLFTLLYLPFRRKPIGQLAPSAEQPELAPESDS